MEEQPDTIYSSPQPIKRSATDACPGAPTISRPRSIRIYPASNTARNLMLAFNTGYRPSTCSVPTM